MKFWMKIHRFKDEKIVGFCDEDILGRKLNFNGIDVVINEKFYKGSLVSKKELINELEDATIINAFGKNSINLLIKLGFISKNNILYVEGVPHAQYAKIK